MSAYPLCVACPLSAMRGSLRFCKLLHCKRREIIFDQGDPAFGFYCLCEGAVKLWQRTRNGRHQLLTMLEGPSVFVGAEALVTACALEESCLLFVAREDFGQLSGLELLKACARLLTLMEKRLTETLGLCAQERLEQRGWIRHNGRSIEVLDPKALESWF